MIKAKCPIYYYTNIRIYNISNLQCIALNESINLFHEHQGKCINEDMSVNYSKSDIPRI